MKLSHSIALSLVAALGAHGLVIPQGSDVIDVFHHGKDLLSKGAEQVLAITGSLANSVAGSDSVAPLVEAPRNVVPHKYMVVFKPDVTVDDIAAHMLWVMAQNLETVEGYDPTHSFFAATQEQKQWNNPEPFQVAGALTGYAGYIADEVVDLIRKLPLVEFVERDSMVYASEFDTEKGAPWGLARISHRKPLSLGNFNEYLYDNEGGEGVTAYVIDTGIQVSHEEFQGRAHWGKTIPNGDYDEDGNGHGTHCAGTIALKSYGVAKKADVVAVKVLRSNGSGTMSDVVKGVEFAANSHQKAVADGKKGFKGSTANMSLGGGKLPALDLAVNAAVRAGLHFAVAAGNENQDACNTSPAAAENAITVGASTISDARAYFSNYGKCVDIFAPGLNILSTYIGSDRSTATLSGTSMASPHVAGLLSYFLSLQPDAKSEFFVAADGVTPKQLKKNLITYGSKNLLLDIPNDGTPNILVFNGGHHGLKDFWGDKPKDESAADKITAVEQKVAELFEDLKAGLF